MAARQMAMARMFPFLPFVVEWRPCYPREARIEDIIFRRYSIFCDAHLNNAGKCTSKKIGKKHQNIIYTYFLCLEVERNMNLLIGYLISISFLQYDKKF